MDNHRPLRRVPATKIKSTFQIVQRTIDVASAAAFEERARAADLVIRVPVDLGSLEFKETRRIARRGERIAQASLAAVKAAIGAEP